MSMVRDYHPIAHVHQDQHHAHQPCKAAMPPHAPKSSCGGVGERLSSSGKVHYLAASTRSLPTSARHDHPPDAASRVTARCHSAATFWGTPLRRRRLHLWLSDSALTQIKDGASTVCPIRRCASPVRRNANATPPGCWSHPFTTATCPARNTVMLHGRGQAAGYGGPLRPSR